MRRGDYQAQGGVSLTHLGGVAMMVSGLLVPLGETVTSLSLFVWKADIVPADLAKGKKYFEKYCLFLFKQ